MENKETKNDVTKPVETKEAEVAPKNDTLKKGLALAGLFVLLIIGMVGSVILIPRGINSLASVSLSSVFKPKEKIAVTADNATLTSGDATTFSWNGPIRTEGSYTISYPCKDGVSVNFHSGETITCNVPFYFTSPDNTASIKIHSTSTNDVDVPFYINFKNNNNETSQIGDVLVTVIGTHTTTTTQTTKPASSTSTASTPTSSKPVIVGQNSTNAGMTGATTATITRLSDLAIRLLAIGYIDASNKFIIGTNVPADARPALKFEVINQGGKTSGPWTFKAVTPSSVTPVFNSGVQASLASGDRIEYTLGFDNNKADSQVVISVNDSRTVTESDYSNNTLTYTVHSTNSSGSTVTTSSGTDLSIRVSDVGYIQNGVFVSSPNVPRSYKTAVKFIITNNGTNASGDYLWKATLPSTTDSSYTSGVQTSLAGGKSIEYTVTFDNLQNVGNNKVIVTVDPSNNISETNENNNTASAPVVGY